MMKTIIVLLVGLLAFDFSGRAAVGKITINPITTNSPAGMTNVIQAIGGGGGGDSGPWTNNEIAITPSNNTNLVTIGNAGAIITGNSLAVVNDLQLGNKPTSTSVIFAHENDSDETYFSSAAFTLGAVTNGSPPNSTSTFSLEADSASGSVHWLMQASANDTGPLTANSFFRFGHGATVLFGVESDGNVTANQYVVAGTTNQIIFGATNNAPATPGTIVKWISVQVQGEPANVYRIPLYK